MQSTKRVALSSPDPESTNRYVIAQMFTLVGGLSGDVKLYQYHQDSATSSLIGRAGNLSGLKTVAWSGHPSYDCLLACGTTQGKVHILNLDSATLQHHHESKRIEKRRGSVASSNDFLGTLNLSHNRQCMALAWSSVDPSILIAGYDKIKQQNSLCVWDLEQSVQTFAETPVHLRPRVAVSEKLVSQTPHDASTATQTGDKAIKESRKVSTGAAESNHPPPTSTPLRRTPLQQYLPSDSVNSVATFSHTNTLALAGTSSRFIKCIDLRAPGHGGSGENADNSTGIGAKTPTSGETSLAFKLSTRSILNLTSSPLYPHLFASSEDGLSGVVKIWDTRFLKTTTSTPHPGLINTNNHDLGAEICTFEASGRGGVVGLQWDLTPSERGGSQLGVGTKDGGVMIFDVMSGETVQNPSTDDESGFDRHRKPSPRRQWTSMTGVKTSES